MKDHGVVGDGHTDDTAALQALLSSMEDGDVIYFPAGTYRITHELVIHKSSNIAGSERRHLGNSFIGNGADTVLKYDGEAGGNMLRIRGMLHYRMIGLTFDGSGVAARGMCHDNRVGEAMYFQTHLYHEYILMKDFMKYGIYFGPIDGGKGGASAETVFKHMIFENCGTGIGFLDFNDYNFTFDGCIFRQNARMGIECSHGNFYVRNSRFEDNQQDVYANPQHSCSIRRSVSIGSGSFLKYTNSISPVTVESCLILDWKDEHALALSGAPALLFDNRFESETVKSAAIRVGNTQPVINANNSSVGVQRLFEKNASGLVTADLPDVSSLILSAEQRVIPAHVDLPQRLFDAKEDFGAVGDGVSDDTQAIQDAIDAARKCGNGAMAYLPKGTYRVTRTLEVNGSDYAFGGSGLFSAIEFDGAPDSDAVRVQADGTLTLDAFSVRRKNMHFYKVEKEGRFLHHKPMQVTVSDFKGKGADIRQIPSGSDSFVTYHTVYVSGKYKDIPFILGLRLDGLTAGDKVLLENIEGNLHIQDSGDATILHATGYEGTLWLSGENGDGFVGIMTRLTTLAEYSLYVESSHSLVASDYYLEQGSFETGVFLGNNEDEPGRLTLTFTKNERDLVFDGYKGRINFVASQFFVHEGEVTIDVLSGKPDIGIFATYFYLNDFNIEPCLEPVDWVASSGSSEFNMAEFNLEKKSAPKAIYPAIQDFRKLGEIDWDFNYKDLQ